MNYKLWSEAEPAERIEQGVRVLSELPEHDREQHWDMAAWGRKTQCGTVACAAGHMGLDTWFRKHGYWMTPETSRSRVRWPRLGVRDFFGAVLSSAVFENSSRRPVEDLIGELQGYAAALRATDGDARTRYSRLDAQQAVQERRVTLDVIAKTKKRK